MAEDYSILNVNDAELMRLMGLPYMFHNSNSKKFSITCQTKKGKKRYDSDEEDFVNYENKTSILIKKEKKEELDSIDQDKTNRYFHQRYYLWSKYDQGIKMDEESWYSVTPEWLAKEIAEHVVNCLDDPTQEPHLVVLDSFCGSGGNSIQFALHPRIKRVLSVDIDRTKIDLLKNNAEIYECLDKIELICADYKQAVHDLLENGTHIDCVFLSPPWGGPEYQTLDQFQLKDMTPDGNEIVSLVRRISQNIAVYVPRTFDFQECQKMISIIYTNDQISSAFEKDQLLYYVYEHMFTKKEIKNQKRKKYPKAYTIFYNDLAQGISETFDEINLE